MDRHARWLLRRLAMGIPILVAPALPFLTGCIGCGTCPAATPTVTTHALTTDIRSRIFFPSGALDAAACDTVCHELDGQSGTSDSARADAGTTGSVVGVTASCSADATTLTCRYVLSCGGGRAPQALLSKASSAPGIASWLARAAHLEAASVPAFEELADELALHGAPRAFVRAARRSAVEEARHAASVGRLAHAAGAAHTPVVRGPSAPRSLVELARDNAAEGCVREAHAALVAAHQATHATSRAVRLTYANIAADEARHALLSYAIHDWALGKLGARGADVEAQRRHEAQAWRMASEEPLPSEQCVLGLPSATMAAELAQSLV